MKRVLTFLIALMALAASPLFATSVPTMDKDELKSLLGSENLVILDVRLGKDWSSSEFKIKDALRVDNKDLSAAMTYPKDNTFVLYCA
ncbi:MAG: rhodanese-like domain-containing protein [Desulfobulbaceae bacterium]|nr:rhodanese-like domain-containing protein [Desulfobulbaceae bacterium]